MAEDGSSATVPLPAFAAAVRRVADARKIPVADLYTTFSGMKDLIHPYARGRDLVLSKEGQNVAAEIMARALVIPP